MSVLHSLSRSKVEYISSSYLKRILVILWTILVSYPICTYAGTLNPIIALPGLTGSIIEIEANNAVMPGLCPRTYTRKRMWLSIEELFLLRCWRESMKLTIDSDGFGAPPDGLQGYVSNDGIFATSCIDPSDFVSCSITKYMGKFFKYLISQGYTSGLNLDAIAYDWRYSHLEFRLPGNYFSRLQRRVESMYAANGNMKVTLVGHSMGAATTTLFLSLQEASWKDKYIRMFISVSGAFSGAPSALLSTIIGDPLVVISASTVQEVVVTYPGIHSLLPANTIESEPFSPSDPVVTLGTENFTINDIPSLYEKVGLAEYAPIVNKLRGRYQVPPGVRTHCVFGSGFDTLSSITIPDPNQMDKFTSEYVDGDKTLTLRGQQVCAQFATRQVQSVTSLTFNHDHQSIISDAVDVWEHIFEITNDRPPGAFNSVIKMRPVSLLHAFLFFRIVFF